jgi:hypothetical protein
MGIALPLLTVNGLRDFRKARNRVGRHSRSRVVWSGECKWQVASGKLVADLYEGEDEYDRRFITETLGRQED